MGATYVITVKNGKLTVEVGVDEEPPLVPTYADAFRDGNGTLIHFTRNAEGRVDGADMKDSFGMIGATARVERIHFTRVQ